MRGIVVAAYDRRWRMKRLLLAATLIECRYSAGLTSLDIGDHRAPLQVKQAEEKMNFFSVFTLSLGSFR